MTDDERKLLEAELCKLSLPAQELMKKFFHRLYTLEKMVIQCNGNLPHEIWRDICGYEGFYQVSNFGRVKSLHFDRRRRAQTM